MGSHKRTMKRRTRRNRSSKMRGGYSRTTNLGESAGGFASSPNAEGASTWVEGRYGDTNQQYNSVFDVGSKTLGNSFTTLPASQQPSPQSMSMIQNMSGGRRHRKSRGRSAKKTRRSRHRLSRKSKKGGMFAGVLQTAAVPFGLLAIHNRYGKKARKGKKSRRSRK